MTREEYEAERRAIIDSCDCEIGEHLSAGCYGDAENARRWREIALRELEEEYRGKARR